MSTTHPTPEERRAAIKELYELVLEIHASNIAGKTEVVTVGEASGQAEGVNGVQS